MTPLSPPLLLPRELRGARVHLRPWADGDVDDVFAYACDVEWARYLPVPQPYLREHAVEFLRAVQTTQSSDHYRWAIVVDGRPQGGIDLHRDASHKAMIGYSIARPLWGRGLMTEAAALVLAAAFSTWAELVRVWSFAQVDNAASVRVMEKIGMTREGVLRKHMVHRGAAVDAVLCAIVR